MLRFLDPANALTMVSLGGGLACCLLAIQQRVEFALVALIVSGICDLFDGVVARRLPRTEEQRRFGMRLDSLVDACAFGFTPAVLLLAVGLTSWVELPVVFSFAGCAVWRLAYFDAVTSNEQPTTYYVGLPTTYVALFLPLGLMAGLWMPAAFRQTALAVAAGLAVAMVWPVRVPKPNAIGYVCFSFLGIGAILFLLILGVGQWRM